MAILYPSLKFTESLAVCVGVLGFVESKAKRSEERKNRIKKIQEEPKNNKRKIKKNQKITKKDQEEPKNNKRIRKNKKYAGRTKKNQEE
jgi:hypothetical protein